MLVTSDTYMSLNMYLKAKMILLNTDDLSVFRESC